MAARASPFAMARALLLDGKLPRAVRDFVGYLNVSDERPYSIAEALATLRAPGALLPRRAAAGAQEHLAALAIACEATLRALGHDPGATPETALALAERLRVGCWLVLGTLPFDAPVEIVLGGILWDDVPALSDPATPPPSGGRLLQVLTGSTRPTRWSVLLGTQPEAMRPRLEKVRRVVEAAQLVGHAATGGDWTNHHYFAFLDGGPLSFTRRAWGDFQSALTEAGDYLDWYG